MKNLAIIFFITFHTSLFTLHSFSQPCLPNGITFTTQTQIDSFQVNYPGCTEIEGDVFIKGDNITNLSGLIILTHIYGNLGIGDNWGGMSNPLLVSISGSENLTSVGGWLSIENNIALIELNGLENLLSVGEDLFINNNASLVNLSGLENVSSVGGYSIVIFDNESLNDISGLENIDPENIEYLEIGENPLLSKCEVQSICNYIGLPNASYSIGQNAPGCNSAEEVEAACAQSVDEVSIIDNLSIHPNPFSNTITIEFELRQPETIKITIYNHLGEKIEVKTESKSIGQQKIEWNCKRLYAGIYFCVLKTNEGIQTIKMIKL